MRASSIILAAASLLAASANAECGQLAPSEIAILANCGDSAELAECLTPGDKCIKKCLSLAGCTDSEVASSAKWFHNDCQETRTFGDLRKRLAANEDEDSAEDATAADAATENAAEATAAADETTAAAEATEATEVDEAATTAAEETSAATLPKLETQAAETTASAAITTAAAASSSIVVKSAAQVTGTATTTAATAEVALVCLTTKFVATSVCTTAKGAKTGVCTPTTTPEIGCGAGLLCQMTDKGEQICMVRKDAPDMAGTIVICCLSVFLATMIGTVTYLACKTKKEQAREKKMAEALAIANGMKAPGSGGAAATEAYVPLMGARGRGRDSSANPFNGGSGRNSRRPSTLGMGATSPGGYGGMGESRSPVDSRAPSPLGMPGATEDLSYGGGRRI